MDHDPEKNNKVYIYGEIVSEATFSHEVYGEGFYELSNLPPCFFGAR